MKLLTIDNVPGKSIEALGLVRGTTVQTKNVGRDFMASMKTLVGGELTGYTEMLVEARQIATKRMVDEAESMGADAIIGVMYGSSAIMQAQPRSLLTVRRCGSGLEPENRRIPGDKNSVLGRYIGRDEGCLVSKEVVSFPK